MSSKQEQFLSLYEPVHERFERFCRARVYGEMDYRDLMNDTLLVAFEKLDTLKSKEAFLAFLFGICVRIVGNAMQKKKELRLNQAEGVLFLEDKASNTSFQSDVPYLYEALAKLSDEQRESIILFELNGFSLQEIAEIQGASLSAVK